MYFASDNSGPAHPRVIEAVVRANEGYAPSYGGEAAMDRAAAQLREIFDAPEAAVYLVATGGAANALSLATLVNPWSTIYCHVDSHIEEDECGAPEFFTGGAKLTCVEGADAKIDPESLHAAMARTTAGFVHNVEKGALSLTQVTERGGVYTLDALRELTGIARAAGLPVQMDGARFANGLVALGCSAAEMAPALGVDALSFGATKNGCLGVEAVILFDPAKAREFEFRRKRGGQLISKHRFLSAQLEAYLEDGLWLDLATMANARAADLAAGLARVPEVVFDHPVEANMLFFRAPRSHHRALVAAGAEYYMDPGDGPGDELLPCRMVTNWATTPTEVGCVLDILARG